MGQDIPKQFINVYDKPVLIYTLEGFQSHPMIDEIVVVCIEGWENVVRSYAKQFNITKMVYSVWKEAQRVRILLLSMMEFGPW